MKKTIFACLTVLVATSVFAVPIIDRPGFPEWTHEALRYPELLAHVVTAIEAGVAFPRWLPDLAAGYGCPTFIFYPPLLFLIAGWACALLGIDPGTAVLAVTIGFGAVGVTGIYCLARAYADRPTSALATILYAMTPYGFVNLYVRGDLTEFAAMQLVPWCLWGANALVAGIRDGRRLAPAATGLAVALAAIVYAHPLPALVAWAVTIVLLATGGRDLPPAGRRCLGLVGAAVFLCAAIGSAPYWWPAAALGDHVRLDGAFEGYFQAGQHVVFFTQFFMRGFEFGSSAGMAEDTMSFQLGLPHFLLAAAGVWLGRRHRLLVVAFACYVALLVLMTPIGYVAWEYVPGLHVFQFPWRLLTVTASLQALCLIGWTHVPIASARRRAALLGLLLLATVAWHANMLRPSRPGAVIPAATLQAHVAQERGAAVNRWRTYGNVEEFLPRTAAVPIAVNRGGAMLVPRGSRPLLETERGTVEALDGSDAHAMRFRVTSDGPTTVLLHQFGFPGWAVRVDGERVSAAALRDGLLTDGRMTVALAACPDGCVIEARYAGPPGAGLRAWLAFLAFVGGGAAVVAYDRRRLAGRP